MFSALNKTEDQFAIRLAPDTFCFVAVRFDNDKRATCKSFVDHQPVGSRNQKSPCRLWTLRYIGFVSTQIRRTFHAVPPPEDQNPAIRWKRQKPHENRARPFESPNGPYGYSPNGKKNSNRYMNHPEKPHINVIRRE